MFKILIICSANSGSISPFVMDQVEALKARGVEISVFLLEGKGLVGYLRNLPRLRKCIAQEKPQIVHAHYGLCGTVAVLQRKVPVVVTYHGSDINLKKVRNYSLPAMWFSRQNIFVSRKLLAKSGSDGLVIPCGVDLDVFFPMDKQASRLKLGLSPEKKYILFSSAFNNPVKNSFLAKEAVGLLGDEDVTLLELKGYTRGEVACLLNAVDLALLTSFSEGSPQFVKEALACNCPVVATDVGDVAELLESVNGCYLTTFDPQEISQRIGQCLRATSKIDAQGQIKAYSSRIITERILKVYQSLQETGR